MAAEFVLGLTKTAVEGTLSLVKSAVEEEAVLKERVQNDLVFITGEFEMMKSFLRVATRERVENEVALTWVRQLRYLAFDVEDCIEFVFHLDNKSRWGWLQRAWHRVYFCTSAPLSLDVAVAEIKQIKARVEDVSQRNERYNLIHNYNKSIMLPVEEPDTATCPSSAFHILRGVWNASGKRRHNMVNLQDLIARDREDDDLQVISVWGSTAGDLGTASIFRNAYCDPKICEKFKCRAWVKLMHPFNSDEFLKSLLTQFYASYHQANAGVDFWTRMKAEVTEDNLMKAKLMQKMREQRYLVVLEDVFAVPEWDLIRMYLPDSKNGSRILVSTPQLGMALLCTGEPYQVSELRHFSDDQFLCAFFKKTRSDMGEFNWQLRRRGVISVWGAGDDKSILVDKLYKGIINTSKEFDGVEFERHSWVDVPDPFDLKVFAQRLFLNFYSDDIRAGEIKAVGKIGETGLIQQCCKFLFEDCCLVVINDLQSMGDWDLIKSKFLSKPIKGCIVVVTNEETVATHCVKDHEYQALYVEVLKDETAISTLNKCSWYFGLGGINKGRLFYNRRRDAHAVEWTNMFKNDCSEGLNFENVVRNPDEQVMSVLAESEIEVHGVKAFLTNVCYGINGRYRHSWVGVPHPFNLTDFSCRLLLDFYSDDPQAKEAAAVGLMEGDKDPFQQCREILREGECFLVIDGLRSTQDWDLINATILSELTKCPAVVIITSEKEVAAHFEPCNFRGYFLLDKYEAQFPNIPEVIKEYRCLFSSERRENATKWTEKFELVGRETEGLLLTELVVKIHGVVSVWGIAGVGKSSLVMSVYYNIMLQIPRFYRTSVTVSRAVRPSYKFTLFGWVDVPHPFNLTEFSRRLLLDFHSDDPRAKENAAVSMMEGQDPIQECCKLLHEEKERCLVVIDGLRSTQDWDLIKATFLSVPIEGTIVVITTEAKLAMHCVGNSKERVMNIRRLEADSALNVLNKIAWEGKQLTPKEMELSEFIVAKCGGLPKVIAAIGELCSSYTREFKSPVGELESLRDNFMGNLETGPEFHGLRAHFAWMQSYFDACSDSIKPCIFYLSIFYAEKNIRWRRLLWRWITEGYCRDTSGGTSEENGAKLVSELINLSIVRQSSSKALCQINGFFHEYIISRPMEDNLVFALEGHCSLNSQRAGQHLTIRSSWNRDKIVFESIDFSRLRSLTVFGKWEPFFISNKNVNMGMLRVLDLEDATYVTNDDLEQIGKLLPRLKFLSLRGCKEITCLPSSMGGLRQLQTLDIRHTSIVTLPLVITKLQKLRYIRAGISEVWDWDDDVLPADGEDRASSSAQVTNLPAATVALTLSEWYTDSTDSEDRASSSAQATNVPPLAAAPTAIEGGADSTAPVIPPAAGSSVSCSMPRAWVSCLLSKLCRGGLDNGVEIGKLSALHTLGVVNVNGSCGKSIFVELKKLTQLRKLGVSGINKENIKDFCSAISGHAHLKSLSVELDKDDNLDGLDDIPQPPKTLNSLKLYGRVHKLLVWNEQLENLEKLKLDLTIVDPVELQKRRFIRPNPLLRSLHHLRIRPIQDGELKIGQIFSARVVEIQCSSALSIKFVMWGYNDTIVVLKVHCSRGLSLQISGLSELRGLNEVWLKGYSNAHKQYMQRQIDEMDISEHQKRPVLKLVRTRSS